MLSTRLMLIAALAAFLLCACGSPRIPLFSNNANADHAQTDFLKGVMNYEKGDYAEALSLLQDSLKDGLRSDTDKVTAHKFLAFINCFSAHEMECRSEFRKAFEIDPEFELEPEEDGHPIWGPIYLDIKKEFSHSNSSSKN